MTKKPFGSSLTYFPGVFLFAENLIRLIMLYPIAIWMGEDSMWIAHYYFWKYGHLAIILTLFGLWFMFVVWKDEILHRDDTASS